MTALSEPTIRIALRSGSLSWGQSAKQRWILFTVVLDGEIRAEIEAEAAPLGLSIEPRVSVEQDFDQTAEGAILAGDDITPSILSSRAYSTTIPLHVKAALADLVPSNRLIWLEFDDPVGYLPALPWEKLFWDAAKLRIIRKAPGVLKPIFPRGKIDAVVCASCAIESTEQAESLVDLYFSQLPPTDKPVFVHVFAGRKLRKAFRQSAKRFGSSATVLVYDPPANHATVPDDLPRPLRTMIKGSRRLSFGLDPRANPWFDWMREELKDESIEFVHFISNGYLGIEQGGLHFATPFRQDDGQWLRIASAREIEMFLTRLGAWSVTFSSPPGSPSIAGLRQLQHELSRFWAGPSTVHDMALDEDKSALRVGYGFFSEACSYPGSPALSLYWHPDRLFRNEAISPSPALIEEFTIARLVRSEAEPSVPLVRMQRQLERSVNLLQLPQTDVEVAIRNGRETALSFVSGLIEEHYQGQQEKW